MKLSKSTLALAVTLALLGACSPADKANSNNAAATAPATAAAVQNENEKISAFFEKAFMDQVELSPTSLTYLGIKKDYDKWEPLTDEQAAKVLALTKQQLEQVLKRWCK